MPLLKSEIAHDGDEAARIAESFATPVVMKVMSADVVHKFDAGGVILNVHGEEEARAAYKKILANVEKAVPGAKVEGILVEQMARKGVEVILGASRDPRFGPLMMFGLGGTLVEVLKDVSFRLAPMWQISAERMVHQIRAFKVLDGFRGTPPSDIASIVDTLLRLSAMVCNHPEISELDINPLIVHAKGEGCSVADSRIMLKRPRVITNSVPLPCATGLSRYSCSLWRVPPSTAIGTTREQEPMRNRSRPCSRDARGGHGRRVVCGRLDRSAGPSAATRPDLARLGRRHRGRMAHRSGVPSEPGQFWQPARSSGCSSRLQRFRPSTCWPWPSCWRRLPRSAAA